MDFEPSGEAGTDAQGGEEGEGWDSQDGASLREESLEEASWGEGEGSGSVMGEASMLMTDKVLPKPSTHKETLNMNPTTRGTP